jgi:hypothetical protein
MHSYTPVGMLTRRRGLTLKSKWLAVRIHQSCSVHAEREMMRQGNQPRTVQLSTLGLSSLRVGAVIGPLTDQDNLTFSKYDAKSADRGHLA